MDIVYRAFDGQIFETEDLCILHENRLCLWINDIYWAYCNIENMSIDKALAEFQKVGNINNLESIIDHAYAIFIGSETALARLQDLYADDEICRYFPKTGLFFCSNEDDKFKHYTSLLNKYDDIINEAAAQKAKVNEIYNAIKIKHAEEVANEE